MKTKNLKLNASTTEDIKVISAHLQDAITQSSDMINLKKIEFSLCSLIDLCEDVEKGVFRKSKRIQSVLKFENILSVLGKTLIKKKRSDF